MGNWCSQQGGSYVSPRYYYSPYDPTITGLSWYAVRAYLRGRPLVGGRERLAIHWNGWDDYAAQNGINCTRGSIIKGGDGIVYS